MPHFVRMGHPDERQPAPGLMPGDIDRGTPERMRLNRIKTEDELSDEQVSKAVRKVEKTRQRLAAKQRKLETTNTGG